MSMPDPFSEYYKDFIENTYDCVDRFVLNAYFPVGQSGGGFRSWWRILEGTDGNLDEAHLMRYAGRFSRRVKAFTKQHRIPLIFAQKGERKQEISALHLPKDPAFRGVFCIIVGRAPAPVWGGKALFRRGLAPRTQTTVSLGQSIFVSHHGP